MFTNTRQFYRKPQCCVNVHRLYVQKIIVKAEIQADGRIEIYAKAAGYSSKESRNVQEEMGERKIKESQ
ncbi:hypothetical protein DPMN_011524 [Dreissena polymorpha]|uniref:Uncharacterized protein n=1 Tax=Dreissena polymorpha TaxID=45954 RepID=A0A9D4S2K5_DREPO|nr:hypothetical protein DPMN_011524 [Dreissena polymorpha]